MYKLWVYFESCVNATFLLKHLNQRSYLWKQIFDGAVSIFTIWRSALFDWTDESSHAYSGGALPKINLLRDILLFYFVEYWGVLISFKIKSGLSLWGTKCTRDTFDNEDFRQLFTSISSVSKLKNVVGPISNNKHVR